MTPPPRARAVASLVAAAVLLAGAAESPAAQSVDSVVGRAATYVAAYERDLGTVIAEEQYRQDVSYPAAGDPEAGVLRRRGNPVLSRTLRSEFLFLQPTSGSRLRLGFRDVLLVDGRSAPDRTGVQARLATQPEVGDDEVRRLLNDGARYNLGSLTRNVNVPTFALLIVRAGASPQFSFEKRGERRIAGVSTWEIAFEERLRPTLIRSPDGREMPAKGAIWIHPTSGRVLRTDLATEDPQTHVRARLAVDYRPNGKLGLWVPVEMTEDYHVGRPNSFDEQNIHCVARYSNFRRFEVRARIRVPGA